MAAKLYTTVQAARAAKVPRATVQFWIASGKIAAPEVQLQGGKAVRFWSDAEIRELRKLKRTVRPGPKKSKKKR